MPTGSVKQNDGKASARIFRHQLVHSLLDTVFPRRCAGDHTWSSTLFCDICRDEQQRILPPLCACCGRSFGEFAQVLSDSVCADCRSNRYHPAPHIDQRRAPFEHSGPILQAIHSFKYQGQTSLAHPLALLLQKYLQGQSVPGIPYQQLDFISPVPLHPVRHWRRGYNQSALLARHLSHLIGVPSIELLKRTRRTRPQTRLNAKQRAANVSGAFTLQDCFQQSNFQSGETRIDRLLLIDDVATTGATLEECAQILKTAGVREIYALTLARRD